MGVCFVGEVGMKDFLKEYIDAQPGEIREIESNKVLGFHEGAVFYTIGQRHGLYLDGEKGVVNDGLPYYVVKKDIKNNILYVASGPESDRLNSDSCLVSNLNFITDKPKNGEHIYAKFRYRQKDNGVTIFYKGDDLVELKFDEPYKAVTPGQAAVFYDGDICLGGGLIDSTYYKGKRTDL